MNIRKRLLSFIICGVMALSASPLTAFADDSVYTGGLCEHHMEHNEECGYVEAVEESPCTHEHTEECYRLVTDCVHEHTEECYSDGKLPAEGEEKTADACAHECGEESGCITKELDCEHEHNEECGYVPAKEGNPCGYWCEICAGETEESDKADVTDEIEETDEIDKTEEIDETDETEESEKSFSPMSERAITPTKPVGEGTENSPYEIGTAAELYWFAGLVNGTLTDDTAQNTGAWAELTADIIIPEGETWTAIGNYESVSYDNDDPKFPVFQIVSYTGTFDGKGHTISNLYSYEEYGSRSGGLFGNIGAGGTVKNVGILDSVIKHLTVNSSRYWISPFCCAGGICGYNGGTIENCYSTAKVINDNFFSYSGLEVDIDRVGGVCGYNDGTIKNCYNTGSVSSDGNSYIGGVCGYNNGTIINCYNTGKVSDASINLSYVGGICGYNNSTIKNCYNTGEASNSTSNPSYVGSACGHNDSTMTNCYFLTGTADKGTGDDTGEATEKTDSQFKSGEVAWLLQNGQEDQEDQVWGQEIVKDELPRLSYNEDDKVCKVTFMNSDAEIQVAYANYNTALTEPEFVVAEDEKIDGWYENGDFSGNAWNFENGIVQDITLYVKISKIQYNVTLKADGDGTVSGGGTYVHGTEVTVTADPDSGFRFVRWEENGTEVSDEAEYTFIIKGDRELTAVFERRSTDSGHSGGSYSLPEGTDRDEPKDEPEEEPEVEPDTPGTDIFTDFSDVPAEAWYSEAVDYATENGIMNGVGGNRFEPEAELKREMLAVILWNMTDNPEPNGIAPFLDVTSDKYYAKAIAWANENGVMYGYGEEFGVGEAVTREDFAAILYRYAAFKGYDTTQGGMAIREFIDFEQIADYAAEALGWAVNSGIISGMGDGTVSPKTSTYRGQAAVMLMKFCENIMK